MSIQGSNLNNAELNELAHKDVHTADDRIKQYKNIFSEAHPDEVIYESYLGFVTSVGDGIAYVHGMEDVCAGELVSFIGSDLFGLALNLESDRVGVVIFGSDRDVVEGDPVVATGQIVDVL